jgi:hypothetical protein
MGSLLADDDRLSIEIDEKTFAARYFSPSLCFSLTTATGCAWFDAEQMKLRTDVELDAAFDGFRLSAIDMKELKVMDVCMRNASRSLLLGRSTVNRITTGQYQCFTAYMSTLYPQRFLVDHHYSGCKVSIMKLPSVTVPVPAAAPTAPAPSKLAKDGKKHSSSTSSSSKGKKQPPPQPAANLFASEERRKKPAVYVATLHGAMSWRTPSMTDGEFIMCAVDRTMTFVKAPRWAQHATAGPFGPSPPAAAAVGPTRNKTAKAMAAVERHHREVTVSSAVVQQEAGKRLLLASDAVHLRPMDGGGGGVLCDGRTEAFASRLAFEYGALQHKGLVRTVLERSTSDAACHATLEALFPPPPPLAVPSTSGTDEAPQASSLDARGAHEKALSREASLRLPQASLLRRQATVYDLSGLSGVRGQIDQLALFAKQALDASARSSPPSAARTSLGWVRSDAEGASASKASLPSGQQQQQRRAVTLAQFDELISSSNSSCTAAFGH